MSKPKTLADRLRTIMAERNMKQVDFAAFLGVPHSYVHRWITGKNAPHMDALVDIARRCEVSLEWLMTGQPERPEAM